MSALDRPTIARILTASGDAGLLVDARGAVLWSEDPLQILESRAGAALTGRPLVELFSPEGEEDLGQSLARVLEGRRVPPIRVTPGPRLLAPAPAPLSPPPPYLLTLVPGDEHKAGQPTTVLALLRAAERRPGLLPAGELTSSAVPDTDQLEIQYRQLLELMPDGVAIINQEGRITYVNLCGANQFGYRVDELVGRWIVDLIAPEDRQHALPAVLRAEIQPEGPVTFRLLRADGMLAVAELQGQVFIDRQGRRSTITMMRDVTHESRLQEKARARHVDEAIALFASGMADELGALLGEVDTTLQAAISGGSAGLTPRLVAERVDNQLERAREMASRLRTIGGVAFHPGQTVLSLNEVVEETDRELRQLLGPSILLRTVLAPDLPLILGSNERLRSVVVQLARNAQQAMPLGGHLLLRTDQVLVDESTVFGLTDARPGRFAMLTVQDDGIGIEPEIVDRIFEPYFTTHGTERGSGLGLALVQAIVRHHRGFLSVESQPGRGTRVRVYLPMPQPASSEPCGRAKTSLPRRRAAGVVLLVDDREGVRCSLQPLLTQAGYRVLVAGDGEEAVDLLARYPELIEVAVIDIARPEQGASRLLRELTGARPGLRFVVLCDVVSRELLEPELAGQALLLDAPATSAELQQALRSLVDDG